jgi:hypothetical protein
MTLCQQEIFPMKTKKPVFVVIVLVLASMACGSTPVANTVTELPTVTATTTSAPELPVYATQTPQDERNEVVAVIVADCLFLTLRGRPNHKASALAYLPVGSPVVPLSTCDANGWREVVADNLIGFVNADYLSIGCGE